MAAIPRHDRELVTYARRWARSNRYQWLAPWVLLAIIAIAGALEWFYSPVEYAIGSYMSWARPVRSEAGRGWELNREGAAAMDTLNLLAEQDRQRRAAGARLTDWSEMPALLDSFEVFSIGADRFLGLYERLPDALQQFVIDPINLLRARTGGKWQRSIFYSDQGDYHLYLISSENVVLYHTTLPNRLFDLYSQLGQPLPARLNALPQYAIAVSTERFFSLLEPSGSIALGGGALRFISNLEGELIRVGVAPRPIRGIWEIGFEVRSSGKYQVYPYWVTEDVGRQLFDELERQINDHGDTARGVPR